MVQQEITIINKLGLHARAAAKFVALASDFKSEIFLIKDTKTVNGKSIMGIMMLAASKGTTLLIKINGDDENDAIEKLTALINNRFDENE
jgi:phosphocarrier protein